MAVYGARLAEWGVLPVVLGTVGNHSLTVVALFGCPILGEEP
jgi:hypothetical protein